MNDSVIICHRHYHWPLAAMSGLLGALVVVSVWIQEQPSTTQGVCNFAMTITSLGLARLAIGAVRRISLVKDDTVPPSFTPRNEEPSSSMFVNVDVKSGSRGVRQRFVASFESQSESERERDEIRPTPDVSADGVPLEVRCCLSSLVTRSGSPSIATELEVPTALSEVERMPRIVRSVLGVVGSTFVAVVGFGVVVAQLERGGKISPFSVLLLGTIFVIATWLLHLGLSCRWRTKSTNLGHTLEQFGIFGFRRRAEISIDVESIWFISNVETSSRFLLFSSKLGWETLALD